MLYPYLEDHHKNPIFIVACFLGFAKDLQSFYASFRKPERCSCSSEQIKQKEIILKSSVFIVNYCGESGRIRAHFKEHKQTAKSCCS